MSATPSTVFTAYYLDTAVSIADYVDTCLITIMTGTAKVDFRCTRAEVPRLLAAFAAIARARDDR